MISRRSFTIKPTFYFMRQYKIYSLLFIAIFLGSCGTETNTPPAENKVKTVEVQKIPTPDFNADSAYAYVKAQVDFGPRIPGTSAHEKCSDYLVAKLKSFGFTVTVQSGTVQTFDQKQ